MKLFLTIFAAIIAASLAVSTIAALVLFGTPQAFTFVGCVVGVFAILFAIDRSLNNYGA